MANEYWFKFNFKDWDEDVKPLSLTARGALAGLIIFLRKSGGMVAVDNMLLARITGGKIEEMPICLNEFRQFNTFDFKFEGGCEYLVSRKITKELNRTKINKDNGSKGGNPNLKKFESPTLQEVKDYFQLNGFDPLLGERAWKGYEATKDETGNWYDSHGNKVKNWKQKMIHVWFKEDNRLPPDSKITTTPIPNDRF